MLRQRRGLRKPNGDDESRFHYSRIGVVKVGGNTWKSFRINTPDFDKFGKWLSRRKPSPLSNTLLLPNADVKRHVGQPRKKPASKWKFVHFPRRSKCGSTWPVTQKRGNIPESWRGRSIHHPIVEKSIVKMMDRTRYR